MNKRQKAKHYKQLYERELALNKVRPIKVEHSYIPFVTYKATRTFDIPKEMLDEYPKDENGVPYIIKDELSREFEDIIYKNLKIYEVKDERWPRGKYEATVKMAFE